MSKKKSKSRSKKEVVLPAYIIEQSQKIDITANAGLVLMAEFIKKLNLLQNLAQLNIFSRKKISEAVHVLALIINHFTGGEAISDTKNLKNDGALQVIFGDIHIPAQNTSSEFLERFTEESCEQLREIIHKMQQKYLKKLSKRLKRRIIISLDSSIYEIFGNCKENSSLSFKKIFGFHPLLLHIHQTGELLDLIFRPGARFTSKGADQMLKKTILRLKPYFDEIILLADSGFFEKAIVDVCEDEETKINFIITSELNAPIRAHLTPSGLEWSKLEPLVDKAEADESRKTRHSNTFNYRLDDLKNRLAKQGNALKTRGAVEMAEFNHTVEAWKRNYRFIFKRQLIIKQYLNPQQDLFDEQQEYFYHGYVTNLDELPGEKIIELIDSRGNQENFIKDFKHGLGTVHVPSKHFYGNYAYFLISMLSWNIKCWLLYEINPDLKIYWKRFRYFFIKVGAQIIKAGGYVIIRFGKGFGRVAEFSRWLGQLKALPTAA